MNIDTVKNFLPCEVNLASKQVLIENRGSPLLQGFPSFKTPHWGVLKFTLFGALISIESFALCGGRPKGFALWKPTSLCKGWTETFNAI